MNTMQQEFDAVVQHLYKQGRPAMGEGGDCLYRSEDGLMCAVGCRIPDSTYDETMEYTPVNSLVQIFPDQLPEEIYQYADMFQGLQYVHDGWYRGEGFEYIARSLEIVADKFGLTFTHPGEQQ